MTREWILPWEATRSPRTKEDLQSLRYGLLKDGFDLEKVAGLQDEHGRYATYTLNVLEALMDYHWVLVQSNSALLLQALSQLVPVTYALTTLRKVFLVTTEGLLERLQSRRPSDNFEDDPSGEYLHRVSSTGLLVWDQADYPASTGRFAGALASLLSKRTKRPTLFLVTTTASEGDAVAGKERVFAQKMEMLNKHLLEGLGRSALALLNQLAYHINILLPVDEVTSRYVVWKE